MDIDTNNFEVTAINEETNVVSIIKSPKMRSPRSRKRRYEEMEKEIGENDKEVPMIDLCGDDNSNTNNNNNNDDNSIPELAPLAPAEPAEPVAPLPASPKPKRRKLDGNNQLSTLSRLSQTAEFNDITFQVGEKQFFGLKAIFAIKSDKFRQLLFPSNGMSQQINYLQINDITVDAFQFIRDYFYDLKPDLNFSNCVNVLNASKLYEINDIQTDCHNFLNKIDNVEHLLSVLQKFGESSNYNVADELNNLLANNINLFKNNGNEIIKSDIFKNLPFNMASKLMESDELGVKEEDLWNESVSTGWVNQYNQQMKLLIRFCLMDINFIFNNVKASNILDDTDLVNIYEYKLGLKNHCNFNCHSRFVPKPKSKRGRRKSSKATKKQKDEEIINDEDNNNNNDDNDDANVEEEEKTTTPKKKGRGRGRGRRKSSARGRSKSKGRKKK